IEKRGVYFSNQIDTFEKYRNVIFGTETDKNLTKFHILKGNEKYQNIPKSITNVFLSSKSSIDSRFIKDFIANSLTNENSSIKLDQVERQLRQFHEKYTDIETFIKKETQQLIELIDKKFDQVKLIKAQQTELAEKLGNNLKYAESKQDAMLGASKEKERELEDLQNLYNDQKLRTEEKQKEIREEIGYYDRTIRDSNKKLKEYQGKNIEEALVKHQQREQLQVDLNMARKEYESLTSNVQSLEMKYSSLLEGLRNERESYRNKVNSKISESFNDFNERTLLLKNENAKKEVELGAKRDEIIAEINSEYTSKQIEFNGLRSEEKVIRSTRFHDVEIRQLEAELADLHSAALKNRSEKSIKNNLIQTLQREWENAETKIKTSLSNTLSKVNNEIAKKKEEIKEIERKLSSQHDAFYGFLEKNVKDWHLTIGKVCNEEILFRSDLSPEYHAELANSLSLYGVSLNLETVEIHSKSIEEYQSEKNIRLTAIREMEDSMNQFQVANNEEKMIAADRYGKQISEYKEDVKVLSYSIELAEKRENKLVSELEEWKMKAGTEVEETIKTNKQRQNLVEEELAVLQKKKNNTLTEFNNQFDELRSFADGRLKDLKERQENEIKLLEEEREKILKDFEEKENKMNEEKEGSFTEKGVDNNQIKEIDKKIKKLNTDIKEIEQYSQLVNDYLKDKREFFDKLPENIRQKEEFVKQSNDLGTELEEASRKHNLKQMELRKEKKLLDEELTKFNSGINHFAKHFRDTPVFNKYIEVIERAEPRKTNYSIEDLCTQLLKNDSYFHEEYGTFQRFVTEFAGKFRLDNHFNFIIRHDASQSEFERFAQMLTNFLHEKKIDLSIAETATQISLVTDSIATKVKELSGQKSKIEHIITLIAEDFKKAEFEESKLIEYIKIKLEESDNKVYKLLKKVEEFKEEHGAFYGEGLFNPDFSTGGKSREVNTRAVRLLDSLRTAIKEQEQEEIRLQDLFELKFNIKEGMNETGWTHKIDSIGSTGTDILVKAIIYITLLNVFIKESSHRSSSEFKIHCIIDEVGQISAHYLKELLNFAKQRNIQMINGLPNKSGLESHYKYTYQFRKEDDGNVRIFPSIVTEVEA
ncbi:MAG: ATP-binding protein, partial [Bacteroidia bacterium]|nr:ATP-binding protein [Bacteroidia bacterium]